MRLERFCDGLAENTLLLSSVPLDCCTWQKYTLHNILLLFGLVNKILVSEYFASCFGLVQAVLGRKYFTSSALGVLVCPRIWIVILFTL